jgi:hypothetical protein
LFPFSPIFLLEVGYKIIVDSRLAFGANQNIIEAEVAKKKEEYIKNKELAYIYILYKSMKVIFVKNVIC